MKSALKEEKKIDMNEIPNLTLKKLKINKHNSTNNIFTQSQKGFYALHKNKKFIKSNKKKTNSFGYTNENSINLRDKNYKNFYKTLQPIRNQLIKISKKNKKNETNLINSKLNLYKSTFIGKFEKINNNKINSNQNANSNINGSQENKLLYEDIIKLKIKMNKLKMDYSFLKSLLTKKDDEIRELERYKEEAKYYYGKKDKNAFFEKMKYLREIILLKSEYENNKIKLRNQKDINNSITDKIKFLDIAEIKNKNDDNMNLLNKKVEEYNKIRKINDELEKEIRDNNWVKTKFIENHNFLMKLKNDFNRKQLEVDKLQEKAYKLKEKSEKMQTKKDSIQRRNSSIKSNTQKLLDQRKSFQEKLMKQIELEKKISIIENKTLNLKNETSNNEQNINEYTLKKSQKENIKPIFSYQSFVEKNPFENKEKKEILYESLITDSKKKQRNLVIKIKELLDESFIQIKKKKKNKIIIKKDKDNFRINNDKIFINDNSKIFGDNTNINSGIKDINLEENEEIIKKNNDFIFLLNVMFYIKNVKKEKIENISLNFKTENYYVETLTEKNNFLNNLSIEILSEINNKKDINKLKDILQYLLDIKYKDNKISFLNEIIKDIYILEDKNKIFFNEKEEEIYLGKIQKIFSDKDIASKLNEIKDEIISYDSLKSLFDKEKFFNDKETQENLKLFQFFIYIIKKKEILLNKKNSIEEFNKKIILEIFTVLNKKNKLDNIDFISALKKFLENKNISLDALLGKTDYININDFMNILSQNEFKVENVNFDLYCALQKYQKEDNSWDIDIKALKADLENL